MKWYSLSQWEAIEIYCRMVAKLEGLSEKVFQDNTAIEEALSRYNTPQKSKAFIEAAEAQIAETDANVPHIFGGQHLGLMYELSRNIKHGYAVILSTKDLGHISKYLNFTKADSEFVNIMPQEYRAVKGFSPNNKQRKFENTRWWLYYYEDYGGSIKRIGVVRAILHLLPFGKAKITNIQFNDKLKPLKEVYTGGFEMYPYNNEYMRLQLRLEKTGEKDLTLLVCVGLSTTAYVILGQYFNLSQYLYSGTVLLERVNAPGGLKPKFFERSDQIDYKQINPVIWQLFEAETNNRISVTNTVFDFDSLGRFLDAREGPANANP